MSWLEAEAQDGKGGGREEEREEASEGTIFWGEGVGGWWGGRKHLKAPSFGERGWEVGGVGGSI